MVERLPTEALTRRQKQIVHLMVFEAKTIEEACKVVGYRLKRGRDLLQSSLFVAELARVQTAHRSGEGPKSLATLIEVRDNRGDGSAARDTARVKAATIIMGEHKSGVSINIHNQNNALYTPGGVLGSGGTVSGRPTVPGYMLDLRENHELDADDPDYRPLIDVTPVSQPAPRHNSGAAPAERSGPSGSVLPAERPSQPAKPAPGPHEFTPSQMRHLSTEELVRLANPRLYDK